jgi:transposase
VNALTISSSLDDLSKEELIDIVSQNHLTITKLQHELDQLKKLVFGSRHERFNSATTPPSQLPLDLSVAVSEPASIVTVQKIEYTRTVESDKKKSEGGRMKLPAHLPRTKVTLQPDEDVTGMVSIGEEITEELDYTPGKFFVRQYARPKYARSEVKEGQSPIIIAELPSRVIDKGIVGPGLMAQILIDKFVDHLPLFRQNERFKREGVNIPSSTMSGWVAKACGKIECLGLKLHEVVLKSGYLEGDETTIKVLDKDKKGKTHLGYYWVYRVPEMNLVLFDYREGRGREGPIDTLKGFTGYLQSDGYGVYDYFGKIAGIVLLSCWAHVRRKFFEAQGNDLQRSAYALSMIQKLYAIERQALDQKLTHEQRLQLRLEHALSILRELEQWMKAEYSRVLPESPIGMAIAYALKRWDKLLVYTTDGRLEIDNNLVENSIRPVALGRKNYLFAGSHDAARRAAIFYSLFGSCKINNVNPYEWLSDILERIDDHPINTLEELLPNRWKPRQNSNM